MSQICVIESEKIVDGGSLMRGNTELIEWNSNLNNLTIADEMFNGCTSLTTFTGNLDKLETAGFWPCINEKINYITGETSYIDTSESGMFYNCRSLSVFNSDFSSLKNGDLMFYNTAITSWDKDLSTLESGCGMFKNTNLTSFSVSLPSLIKGGSAGDYYTWFTEYTDDDGVYIESTEEINEDFPAGMFENTNISSWNIDLPLMSVGCNMFAGCSNLTSFSGDLSSLEAGGYSLDGSDYDYETIDGMFLNCINLNSFNSDISSLIQGDGMFLNCFSLSSIGDNTFDNLTRGNLMFSGTKISSINENFNNLEMGGSMFLTCPFILNYHVPNMPSLYNAAAMFAFNISQLNQLCSHNNIEINDLAIINEGQKIYLDNLTHLPEWLICMFGIIPDGYISSYMKPSLPLPFDSDGNYPSDITSADLSYEIDEFNPILHLFCNDINSIINNTIENYGPYVPSMIVHGRHLTKVPNINDNTVEILTALALGSSIFALNSLGCITASSDIINEFISFGWEYNGDDIDECVSSIAANCFSENYPKVISLKLPKDDYPYYITIFHDGEWTNN